MRIVAGTHRGRTIVAPAGTDTRPTSDRVREALFSTLEARFRAVHGACVLDAFAGSGALGLEALSRGAERITFVDTAKSAVAIIRKNAETLGLTERTTVVIADLLRSSPTPPAGYPFSLLFLDPPYRIVPAQVSRLLEDLARVEALAPGAVIVYEHGASSEAEWPRGFVPGGDKRYGDTAVSYAVWEGEPRL